MSIQLGNQGYLKEALDLLQLTEQIYQKQPKELLKKPQDFYSTRLKQTKADMQKDLLFESESKN